MRPIFLLFAVLLPFAGGAAMLTLRTKTDRWVKPATMCLTVLTSLLTWALVIARPEGALTLWRFTIDLTFDLRLDGLGRFFAAIVATLWPLTVLYAFSYLQNDARKRSFFAFFTMSYGATLGGFDWNWAEARAEYEKAVEINPNYLAAQQYYAINLAMQNDFESAIERAKRCLEIEPLLPIINANLAWFYYLSRQYENAEEQARLTIDIEPRSTLNNTSCTSSSVSSIAAPAGSAGIVKSPKNCSDSPSAEESAQPESGIANSSA